jgi:RNA polymerase sigma factor (sigma-70 family)
LAYQAGDRAALRALHQLLWPLMVPAVRHYHDRSGALPNTLERADLAQQSWLILADLATRWRPDGGDFGAYLRVSFRWALARYVRQNSPSRRARLVLVLSAECPDIQERLDRYPGADGREWDGELAWAELLEPLSERERAALLLHLAEQKTFSAVAQALQLTRPSAYRLYRRALRRVQGSPVRIGERLVLLDPASLNLARQGDLPALVRALHANAPADGRLPGRRQLAERTNLSEHRLTRLLGLLVEAGCVRGRAPRQAGWLVHASAEATLAALGIRA